MATQHPQQPVPDYIVVGGGTSGLVIASRLTEDPSVNVLVLEAGQNHLQDPRVNIPAFWSSLLGTDLDWAYEAEPQTGFQGRVPKLPQGKLLGGSSAVNGQAFIAPSKAGIDAWERLGNPGWNWASLSAYLRKAWTLQMPDTATKEHLSLSWIDDSVKGTTGPIKASFAGSVTNPINKAWAETFNALHLKSTADPFSGTSTGGYNNLSTIDATTKTRSYAGNAYGAPALERPNLELKTGAIAHKINLTGSGDNLTATGVSVSIGGKEETFTAKKEVIVAAGVFSSPKLLELSGIGDETLLKSLGIPVNIANSNVGENLQDHVLTGISYEVVDGIQTLDPLMRREPEAMKAAQDQYSSSKGGPFAVGGATMHAYVPIMEFLHDPNGREKHSQLLSKYVTPQSSEQEQVLADVIAHGREGSAAMFLLQGQGVSHERDATAEHGPIYQDGNYLSIGPIQTHPFSRGSSHIKSADPTAKPRIDQRYFSHPLDLELLARHVLDCETVRNTAPLDGYIKPGGRRNHETRAHPTTVDDAKLYLAETGRTAHHNCGTCSMRPRDKGGVVDTRCVVYGTSNLRVVDASIFPLISRGNTLSTVYAVAEKAADIIKAGRA